MLVQSWLREQFLGSGGFDDHVLESEMPDSLSKKRGLSGL